MLRTFLTLGFSLLLLLPATAQTSEEEIGKTLAGAFLQSAPLLKAPKPIKDKTTVDVPMRGGRELSVLSSAYCLRGVTASGAYVRQGTIAVDPRVIPMGSRLFVPGYGWGVAADTGGMVRGNVIDVWFPTARQCYDWGLRRVNIRVFPPR